MPSVPSLLLMAWISFTVQHFQTAFAVSAVGKSYKIHHNTSMVSNAVISEIQTSTEFACVFECRFHRSCLSVNVVHTNLTGLRCTLFSVTAAEDSCYLREEHGHNYIELVLEKKKNEDCETEMKGVNASSGVFSLARLNGNTITTFCDMQTGTGGWTLLQRRMDGSVDFYRGWQEYKNGFGNPLGEFWLGLDKIHDLTQSGDYTLRFDLWDDTEHRFAEYKNAIVANEAANYRLDFGSYYGTAGDSMRPRNKGKAFTTYDVDNDEVAHNCAQEYQGAWWFGRCLEAHLNGRYLYGNATQIAQGMVWREFRGLYYSLRRTEIKVKRV